MSHSLVKVYVHYVWSTKCRERTLVGDARVTVNDHILTYASEKEISIEALNIQPEHAHALVRLSHDQRIDDVVKLIKGESSHWVNQNDVTPGKFSWQTGYGAFSVSHDAIESVKEYIFNQDEHHKRKSFEEEFLKMMIDAGFAEAELAETNR